MCETTSCTHGTRHPSLRDAGLKRTPQREAILAVLEGAERPLTAEEISGRMSGRRPGLPTIYRNLERFVREGWAESLPSPDQIQRFVRCCSPNPHHHILCEGCGRTAEIDCPGLGSAFDESAKAMGFKVTRHQLTLYGLCAECQRGFSA